MNMGRRRSVIWSAAILVALVAAAVAYSAQRKPDGNQAADAQRVYSIDGMEGISEVRVVIVADPSLAALLNLQDQELRTKAELYLRKVPGISVVDEGSVAQAKIVVMFDGVETRRKDAASPDGYAAGLKIGLLQSVYILRGSRLLATEGFTWQSGYTITGPIDSRQVSRVMDLMVNVLDEFQNRYLKANPRIKGGAG
jgi:hypothetical protein